MTISLFVFEILLWSGNILVNMEVMIIISVVFVAQTSANVCNNPNGACCADYKMVEGVCQPCFGSYGVGCTGNCSAGFFGFGCRSKCHCKADQLCNSKIGCVDINGTGCQRMYMYGILVGISIVTGTVCIILIIYIINRRLKTENNPATVDNKCKCTCNEGQAIEITNPQSSINDFPLDELTSMHCNKISPLSSNFSCRSPNIKMYGRNRDENRSQELRESWCSSNYYSGSQSVNSYDKCHEMEKYDHAMGRISKPFRHALLTPPVRYSSQRFIIEEEDEYCEPRMT